MTVKSLCPLSQRQVDKWATKDPNLVKRNQKEYRALSQPLIPHAIMERFMPINEICRVAWEAGEGHRSENMWLSISG